jgi:tyrosinase
VNIRKSASRLTTAEKKAFVDAVIALKHKPSRLHPTDAERSRYDDFVQVHLDAMMVMMHTPPAPSWGHQAAAFGPWHRALLLEFERELQAIDPLVTLPYWDWTTDATPQSPLWKSDFLGGDGRASDGKVTDGAFAESAGQWVIRVTDNEDDPSFLRRGLARADDADALPTADAISRVMARPAYDVAPWEDSLRNQNSATQWNAFRIHLEIVLHNLVHRWVGGNMVDMASPNDPVFWMHHANCDRLWSAWQVASASHRYTPATGGPAGHNLADPMIFAGPSHHGGDAAATPWETVYRPQDVLDSQFQLKVRYDSEPERTTPLPAPPPPPSGDAHEHAHGHAPMSAAVRQELPMFVLPSEIPAMQDQ